ncbi:BamA/TamA family outer membrane protein [Flaviaesturariibacter amylovorans]|uniref:BamA/TamA family outer membrane protein n=1 Tax=Flaviaesturariibacter amylovorans TaxID=1084520 RepID=UPI0031F07091
MKRPALLLFASLLATGSALYAQPGRTTKVTEGPTGNPPRAQAVAGPQYKAGGIKRTFQGRHYREEWTEPTWVPVLRIDTLGGLTVLEAGGGKQTFSLRLKDGQGRQWALRSVDKDNSTVLPEIARGTFLDAIADDLVTSAHPYAALTVPLMAEAAGVYHTRPRIVLVADDARWGEHRTRVGNQLFLFEERPDDMPEGIPNFGGATEIIGIEKLREHLATKPDHRVDQESYVRARIFDMFLGDWDRHEDQWRWARFKEGGRTLYRPIPRDRDQAYALFQGVIPYLLTLPEELEVLESFRGHIKNVKKYNFPARYLDRQLANEVSPERWVSISQELQGRLTDAVIENAVRQLPPEIFRLSGEEIITKLKSRRSHLPEYAAKYSRFLSEIVEVVGTLRGDRFSVQPADGGKMQVQVFGAGSTTPYYQRSFDPKETDEVRLYGLGGADQFDVTGERNIKLRLIGSADRDSMQVSGGGKTAFVYNNPGDAISVSGPVRVRLSEDTSINRYAYKGYQPNVGHTIKFPSFNNLRGVHFNLGYIYRRHGFRKVPFSWEQRLRANYSIFNKSFGGDYYGIFHNVIGPASLLADARYDQALRHLYFGLGNETKAPLDRSLYRLMTRELAASLGLQFRLGKYHRPGFTVGYEATKILRQENEKYYSGTDLSLNDPSVFFWKQFGTAAVYYNFHSVDNEAIPSKGFDFKVLAGYTQNLKESGRNFVRYEGSATGYIPFSPVMSLVLRAGGSRVDGIAEFYQLPTLGGGASLRGYRRERFRGETVAFNQNELRFLWNFRSWLFNGKAGLIGFFDQGRAWYSAEPESKTWHTGFGAGVMIVPFNRVAITVAYGVTPEDRVINLRLGTKIF